MLVVLFDVLSVEQSWDFWGCGIPEGGIGGGFCTKSALKY